MTILTVYYSRTGITKKAAEEIAQALNCPIERLEGVKSRLGIWGYIMAGREAMLKKCPEIKEVKFDPSNFDLIVIGSPNWAGYMASPLRSYLIQTRGKIKKAAIFITQGGGGAEKVIKDIENLINKPSVAQLMLRAREIMSGSSNEKIISFSSQIKSLK